MNLLYLLGGLYLLAKRKQAPAITPPPPPPTVKPGGPIRISPEGVVIDEATGQAVGTVVKGQPGDSTQTGIIKIQAL